MNEKPLVKQMKENYKYFGGMSLLYGLIFTFCLYKNMSGITFPVCVIATIIFAILFIRKINYKLKKYSLLYIAGMILLSISTVLTSSFFLHFFNLLGIILLFFVFMIHQFYDDSKWNFPAYLKRIFIFLGTVIGCIPYPYWHGSRFLSGKKDDRNHNTLLAVVIGLLLALGVLSIILPLLLKSDLMFSKIFGELLKHINLAEIFGITFMILLGFTFCYAVFCALCKYNFPEGKERKIKYYNPLIGITFTSIISIIYIIYCLIQILYLFIGMKTGLPEGVTYAEYARGGFWELLFVSMINFVMVLLCMYIFTENIVLKAILTIISGCTFIMIISAAYRMILYITVYHLTFLRVLVLWFLAVLALIMGGVVISMYMKKFPLFHYIMAVVSVLYIIFSFSRPDAIIAKYNIGYISQMTSNEAYSNINYFIYNTSMDCVPELAKIETDDLYLVDAYDAGEELYHYFNYISEEYDDIYIRKANYSVIQAKHAADQWIKEHPEYSEE